MVINMIQENSENGFKLGHYTTDTNNSNPVKQTPLLSFNTWYHIAVVRNGDNEKLFVDGVVVAERTYNHTYKVHRIRIGEGAFGTDSSDGQWPTNPLHGYLQDFRISKKAVYTSCFDVPKTFQADVEPIPANEPSCDEVALNIQSDNTNNTDAIEDISLNAHVITKNGDVKHSSSESIFGESSLYFDGNGDHLKN